MKTGVKTGIQYCCACPWLEDAKITLNAGSQHELLRSDLEGWFARFTNPRLLRLELAIDSSPESGIDRDYVRAHARFGKSRPTGGNSYKTLTYGTNNSDSYARCYQKSELDCYRVEVQFHSRWLRARAIRSPDDICRAASELVPARISFVQLDFNHLYNHLLVTRGARATELIAEVRRRSHALHRALKYLKTELEIHNPHRFLQPTPRVNEEVKRAVRVWQNQWRSGHAG